ncbi:hypothetical protein [Roseibium sp. RKSG952]|uniref:hypothetical protein n=1 Tax=Roseibium sp. RKSG952 TaxID=2529384 RepID=UPI0012BC95CE|nr:hypothetical protein [Roseibium sp. RKSG952]MTH96642.1 hypothetical protein [Roseibium sp. RKSG952]
MMRPANKTRGEVALKLGTHDLILCAEMARIEQLEEATGGMNLVALIAALQGRKMSTVKAALICLCIEGDAEKAWSAQFPGVTHVIPAAEAVLAALVPGDEPGEADAGAENG